MAKKAKEYTYAFFLSNGEQVEKLPQWACDKLSERLSIVVSQYFMQHPDEYERFLNSKEHQEYLEKRRLKELERSREDQQNTTAS